MKTLISSILLSLTLLVNSVHASTIDVPTVNGPAYFVCKVDLPLGSSYYRVKCQAPDIERFQQVVYKDDDGIERVAQIKSHNWVTCRGGICKYDDNNELLQRIPETKAKFTLLIPNGYRVYVSKPNDPTDYIFAYNPQWITPAEFNAEMAQLQADGN